MITTWEKGNLGVFLFGKTRRAVLSLLYGNADREYYLREIERITGAGTGPVQRELKLMTESNLVTRNKKGNAVYYQANPRCPIFDELRSIIAKTFGIADVIRGSLATARNSINAAFIFGSISTGTENKASDIDIMVIGDISFGEVVSLVAPAEEKLGREINPVVYPVAEFRNKVKEGHYFVERVLKEQKIFIIGGEDELKQLAE